MNLSKRAKAAIFKHGTDDCIWAAEQHRQGEGGSTIAFALRVHWKTAESMINAGEELLAIRASETHSMVQADAPEGTWMLVYTDTGLLNDVVEVGDIVTSFRGERAMVVGGTPPRHAGSTGRIAVDNGGEFYPSVFNCKWQLAPRAAA